MNDTHPTVAVAELMRILLDEENLGWDEAWEITTKTCAYTNHTIMSEALEKWPIELFLPAASAYLPDRGGNQPPVCGGDPEALSGQSGKGPQNGHYLRRPGADGPSCHRRQLFGQRRGETPYGDLEKQELRDFYEMMPQKFNNKTNGITQRRFLLHGNPMLADWITDKIGDEWITDLSKIKKLSVYVDDEKCQQEFMNIKYHNKLRLAKYIKEHNGIDVDPRSIFDVQVKRLHEYKRQLMNILHVMYLYNQLKDNPNMDIVPRTLFSEPRRLLVTSGQS